METLVEALQEDGPLVLVCSSGHPYSGCFHEPNYWLFKDSIVYPLYISGHASAHFGYKHLDGDVDDIIEELMHGVDVVRFLGYMELHSEYSRWESTPPEEFEPDYNRLNTITAILHHHKVDLPVWNCEMCENECTGVAKFLSYRGNGGVGIVLTDPVCDRCFYDRRWCDECGEVVEPSDDVCPNDNDDEDESGHTLVPLTDCGKQFGLDGSSFLRPGEADGIRGISVVITKKY